MINNNPYNIPEKQTYSQVKVLRESMSMHPHSARKTEEKEVKTQVHMLKKSNIPLILSTSMADNSRASFQSQSIMNSHALQNSTVTQWKGHKEESQQIRELNQKMADIFDRLQAHERKLMILMEVRKHDQNTCFSQSVILSHGQGLTSKQMEKQTHSQVLSFGSDMLEKMQEKVETFKHAQLNMEESIKAEMLIQRDSITQELIGCFRESLQQKFNEEEGKIAECIEEFEQASEKRLEEMAAELRSELEAQLQAIKVNFKKETSEERNKNNTVISIFSQKLQEIENKVVEISEKNQKFKQLVFNKYLKNHREESLIKEIKEQLAGVQAVLAKPCPSHFYNHAHIAEYRSYESICEVSYEERWQCEGKGQMCVRLANRKYFIDREGNLLDQNHFYLLNADNQHIKLSEFQMDRLRTMGMLH